jgi:nickel-dependent lactate racemase
MIYSQVIAPAGKLLTEQEILETLHKGLEGRFARQKVLVLIPDHTRSMPLPFLFRKLVEILQDAIQLDFMVALGTHPPLTDGNLYKLVGITSEERHKKYKSIGLLAHAWGYSQRLQSIGAMELDEIKAIAGMHWHPSLPERVEIQINRAALEYDQIVIVGPTFPHEVAGFSGGAKYLFPGISGPEMINATHWLGALAGVVDTIGIQDTPVRTMINSAANRLQTPVTLVALTVAASLDEGNDHKLAGMFIGNLKDAWKKAAELSSMVHIHWCDKSYQRVLSCAPSMYNELWTGAKAMYKLEPAVALGGEVIIYAPHLEVISLVHGKYIYDIGYHILPYYLNDWERFKHIPLGVLAHSTHLRGSGVMEGGVEKPNVRVTLSSRISPKDCARLNLGYLDPAKVNVAEWQDREQEGILYVPRAGEVLYRLIRSQ